MWDRSLFAVRRFGLDVGRRLGSWRLSIVLMILAGTYYAFLAIWAGSSPPHMVRNIAVLLPFWIVYLLMLVNIAVCLWQRLPLLRRDIGREPRLIERPADWTIETEPDVGPEAAREILRRNGYGVTRLDPDRVTGLRQRWSALGTFLFHGAFFLIAAGFLITLVARQEARIWVAAGEEYTADSQQFLSMSPPRILAAGIPELRFTVREITPEFWRDELLFTRLDAELELPGGGRATTRINRPLWLGASTFLRLSGFGYAPRYELLDRYGHVLDSAFVKLNVFPPGQRDYFVLPDYPHRIYVEVLPDLEWVEGRPVTRSLNLANPGVRLRVFRGRVDLGSALLEANEGLAFEGLTLRFPEIAHWGEFTIVHDPGAVVLFVGYAIALAGLALKVRGGRKEAEWRAGGAGRSGTLRGWGGRPIASTAPGRG